MTRCIVSVATGSHYIKGQNRLRAAVSDPVMYWTDSLPPGSPSHSDIPYSFKAFAIKAAADAGYDLVLWCDASILPIRSMEPLWDLIETQGYFLCRNGWTNGEWCCDAALPLIGITREEALTQSHVIGGAIGVNVRHPIGKQFLDEYFRLSNNGAFRGPWTNKNGEASSDPRVLGHRHDQVCAAIIAARLGMKLTDPPKILAYKGGEMEETILVADGAY